MMLPLIAGSPCCGIKSGGNPWRLVRCVLSTPAASPPHPANRLPKRLAVRDSIVDPLRPRTTRRSRTSPVAAGRWPITRRCSLPAHGDLPTDVGDRGRYALNHVRHVVHVPHRPGFRFGVPLLQIRLVVYESWKRQQHRKSAYASTCRHSHFRTARRHLQWRPFEDRHPVQIDRRCNPGPP